MLEFLDGLSPTAFIGTADDAVKEGVAFDIAANAGVEQSGGVVCNSHGGNNQKNEGGRCERFHCNSRMGVLSDGIDVAKMPAAV